MLEFPYSTIFSRIDSFTNLPVRFRHNRWYGACRFNGQPHRRHDKLCIYMKNGKIRLIEQGQQSISLWDWLLQYGGCSSNADVVNRLRQETGCQFTPEPEVEVRAKYINPLQVTPTLSRYTDTLFHYLVSVFPEQAVRDAYDLYQVGSDRDRTIFWYANFSGRFCLDKIMTYLPDGHRNKAIPPSRHYRVRDGYTDRCFFGEHLLTDWHKEHYVVESEKTALILYLYSGKTVLATGGSSCLAETGQGSILLPDFDKAGETWRDWGTVSEWWRNFKGVEVKEGWDIGDAIVEKINLKRKI